MVAVSAYSATAFFQCFAGKSSGFYRYETSSQPEQRRASGLCAEINGTYDTVVVSYTPTTLIFLNSVTRDYISFGNVMRVEVFSDPFPRGTVEFHIFCRPPVDGGEKQPEEYIMLGVRSGSS